jgi:hypothetical protein
MRVVLPDSDLPTTEMIGGMGSYPYIFLCFRALVINKSILVPVCPVEDLEKISRCNMFVKANR